MSEEVYQWALSRLQRSAGKRWGIEAQAGGRYAITCNLDQPLLRPGAPIYFVSGLTLSQLTGVIDALVFILDCQAEGRSDPGPLESAPP